MHGEDALRREPRNVTIDSSLISCRKGIRKCLDRLMSDILSVPGDESEKAPEPAPKKTTTRKRTKES